MPKTIGKDLVQVSDGYGRELNGGSYYFVEFEGTRTAVEGYVTDNAPDLLGFDVEHGTTRSRVRIKISPPEGEAAEFEYQLQQNRVMKSLFSSEVADVAGISDRERLVIKHHIQNPDPENDPSGGLSTAAAHLWQLHLAGVDGVEIFQPVVSGTMVASAGYSFPTQGNIGRVYTTDEVIAEINPTANIADNMPNYVSADPLFRYGWLKAAPVIQSVVGGRQAMTLEYAYGLWPILLYLDAA